MNNQRILIATGIFSPDIGGPASYARTLAECITKEYKPVVITYSSLWQCREDKKLPFHVVRVWNKTPKIVHQSVFFIKLLFLARKFDVMFALNAISVGIPVRFAAWIYRRKFFVRVVGDYAWEAAMNKRKTMYLVNDFQKFKRKGRFAVLHWLQRWTCNHADGVIVPSQYLANLVCKWGVKPEIIHVVYNGIDLKLPHIGKEDARKQIGIVGNVILSVGRLVPSKVIRMLINIMPQPLEIN